MFKLNVGKRLKYMEKEHGFAISTFIVLSVVAFYFMPLAIAHRITEPDIYPVPVQILVSILVASLVSMFAILMIFGKINLSEADLTDVSLEGSMFIRDDFHNADFKGAKTNHK